MPALWQQSLAARPPTVTSASGAFVTLSDGHVVLDGDAGAGVACLGHGRKDVIEAMARQASSLDFAWSGNFSSPVAEELAEWIVGQEPGGLSHALFVSSGSEAVEAAIKIARQYFLELGETQRDRFIARRQSFHGVTLGALSASGHPARRQPYLPILSNCFSHVSPCFPFHEMSENESEGDYVSRLRGELHKEFLRQGQGRVAAFVAETVSGGTLGCVVPSRGYFEAVREVCNEHGALLILDEIMCGMGRTGVQHAWQTEGISPDIQTIGKTLGGGYQPISATLIGRKVIQTIGAGTGRLIHGQTYQAHPVACAAALKVQRIICDENLLENSARVGGLLKDLLKTKMETKPWFGDVRGRGLFLAVEFLADRQAKRPFDPVFRASDRVRRAAFARGLSVFAAAGTIDGYSGDHVVLAPPFNLSPINLELIADRLTKAADEVFGVK